MDNVDYFVIIFAIIMCFLGTNVSIGMQTDSLKEHTSQVCGVKE